MSRYETTPTDDERSDARERLESDYNIGRAHQLGHEFMTAGALGRLSAAVECLRGRRSGPGPHYRSRAGDRCRLPGGDMNPATLRRLKRVRWAVRATLAFGVAASVAANMLHADPNPISQTIAGWPPLALLLTVELVSRVPIHRRSLAALRVLATAVISGIAAWVSYWHMAGVASRYGETDASPYLLPISVDGLIVVASISLVELAGRIRDAETTPESVPVRTPVRVQPSTVVASRPEVSIQDGPRIVPDIPGAAVVKEVDGQVLDAELIARARQAAARHRHHTGRDITRDQLRAALRTSNATAGELLQLVRAIAPPGGNGGPAQPAHCTATIPTLGGPLR